ncbi:MAG: TlpA family protein disulfide reductase [Richelia sp. SM2_1_7]|nr:TlpA family protein disulfide reductase [Richelia sp. SM2_1_7]
MRITLHKLICFYICFFILSLASGQEKVMNDFQNASNSFLTLNYDKALAIYESLFNNYPEDIEINLAAKYHYAEIFELTNRVNYEKIKRYFEDVYETCVVVETILDKKRLSKFTKVPVEQIIHNTCSYLMDINLALFNYREAMMYLILIKIKYPNQSPMMLDEYFDAYYLDEYLSKCYIGLEKPDSAVFVLLPYITKGSITASEAQVRLSELTKKNQISKKELTKCLNSIEATVDTSKPNYLRFLTTYENLTIKIDSILLNQDKMRNIDSIKAAYSDKIKASLLYESLSQKLEIPDSVYVRTANQLPFQAKYTLLDFWASWCAPCREENPTLIQAYQQFKDKGFEILSISIDTNEGKWQKAIKENKIGEWKHLIDTTGWKSEILEEYSIQSIPANFLISPEGKIIAINLRGEALLKKLEELLGE